MKNVNEIPKTIQMLSMEKKQSQKHESFLGFHCVPTNQFEIAYLWFPKIPRISVVWYLTLILKTRSAPVGCKLSL